MGVVEAQQIPEVGLTNMLGLGLQGILNGGGLRGTFDSDDGQDNLSFEGGTHNAAELSGKLDLNLVNVPLQFTAQNPVGARGDRGVAVQRAVRCLKELIELHRPGLVFLSETKCKARRSERLKTTVNYNGLGVDSTGKGGGLLLLWRKDVDVWLQSFSAHHIDATVKSASCPDRWRFTGFYGYPEVGNRILGWSLLRRLAHQSVRPWVCAGDFNEVLAQHEKQGSLPRAHWQMRDFRKCLDDCGFQDMGLTGEKFTWCNQRIAPHTVRARLDRACCNSRALELFPLASVSAEAVSCSDHYPIWVGLEGEISRAPIRKKCRFRFEAAWASAPDCRDVILRAWTCARAPNQRTALIEKLRAIRIQLSQRDQDVFGNIRSQTRELNDRICRLQSGLLTSETKGRD
ncbi:UNVERIFIED_CONTAM: hypothetical protein Sradi_3180500 [Sesamum radiatum]|uniref:Endonuclease/exonuclease/phosphatase domain-containing protein n=1 Tax=Sesamum radiatum TaxID=300843 RepID=A0AAW2REJ5_SESRA